MRLSLYCCFVLAVLSCGKHQSLPPPGARGPVVLDHWLVDGRQIRIETAHLQSAPDNARVFQVESCLVHLRGPDDWANMPMPESRLNLQPLGLDCHHAVSIFGWMAGYPVLGQMASVQVLSPTLLAEDLQLAWRGQSLRWQQLTLSEDDASEGTQGKQTQASAGMAALLAALPQWTPPAQQRISPR